MSDNEKPFTATQLNRQNAVYEWFKRHPEQEEQYQAFKARFLAETADKPNSWD